MVWLPIFLSRLSLFLVGAAVAGSNGNTHSVPLKRVHTRMQSAERSLHPLCPPLPQDDYSDKGEDDSGVREHAAIRRVGPLPFRYPLRIAVPIPRGFPFPNTPTIL